MNPCVRQMEYAVRGKVPLEAARIQNSIKQVREFKIGNELLSLIHILYYDNDLITLITGFRDVPV